MVLMYTELTRNATLPCENQGTLFFVLFVTQLVRLFMRVGQTVQVCIGRFLTFMVILRGKHLTMMFYTLDIGHLHIEIHTVLLQITFIPILIRTLMYIFKLCINVLLPTNFSLG